MGLRINHNLASLGAALNLGRANAALSSSLAKLSTGLKINTAADGPADLIISEKFRSQINSISKAVENTQNAISMLSTAEGALAEVNALLNKMQGLALKATQTGTQSPDEIAASQAEIDSALASINSISRNTAFGSVNLLDGAQQIRTEGVDTSNILVDIDKANFAGDTKEINIEVINAAQRASTTIDLSADAQGEGASDGVLLNSQVIKVTGNRGSTTITFASGSSLSDMTNEINSQVTQTGVYAESSNNALTLYSAKYGATEFVTVEDVDGDNDLLNIDQLATVPTTSETKQVIDLSSGDGSLGYAFKVGGYEIRTLGQQGVNFDGYKVSVSVNAAATIAANVNSVAKTIDITASTGTTLDDIADLLSTATGIAFDTLDLESTVTLDTTDAISDVELYGVSSNLIITAKAGTASDTHSETPKVSIATTAALGAETAAYNTSQNVITLTLNQYKRYDTAEIVSIANADLTTNVSNFFDFEMKDGGGRIYASLTSSPVAAKDTAVSTSNLSIDLNSAEGMGYSFRAGGTSNFGFKTTALGSEKFADYTITYKTATSASVAIDHANKLITIDMDTAMDMEDAINALNVLANSAVFTNAGLSAAGSASSGIAISAGLIGNVVDFTNDATADTTVLDALASIAVYSTTSVAGAVINRAYFTSVASIASTAVLGTQTEVSSGFVIDGSGLEIAAKDNNNSNFAPKVVIRDTGTSGITYTAATNTINLNLNTAGSIIDTQAELETLLDTSANGAQLRSLFDFNVTGAIVGTTVEAPTIQGQTAANTGGVSMTPGAVAIGSSSGITNTNYIKAEGTDGSLEVNGVKTAANNLRYTFDNGNIRGHITLDEGFNAAGNTSTFSISGKGAFLQIGSKAALSHQIGVGIESVAVDQLATGLYLDTNLDPASSSLDNSSLYTTATLADITSGGEFDLAKNAQTAYDIISQAITEVSVARSKLGALISNTLESNVNSLGVAFENLTASESRIRDVDFAAETAEFTRAQILVQAGTSVAAQANVATQAALQLLG